MTLRHIEALTETRLAKEVFLTSQVSPLCEQRARRKQVTAHDPNDKKLANMRKSCVGHDDSEEKWRSFSLTGVG